MSFTVQIISLNIYAMPHTTHAYLKYNIADKNLRIRIDIKTANKLDAVSFEIQFIIRKLVGPALRS